MKQPKPSQTPWDFDTWGWWCCVCEKFFDLPSAGTIETFKGGTVSYKHKCGGYATYVSYNRNKM